MAKAKNVKIQGSPAHKVSGSPAHRSNLLPQAYPDLQWLALQPFANYMVVNYINNYTAGLLRYAVFELTQQSAISEGSITTGTGASVTGEVGIGSNEENNFRVSNLFSEKNYIFAYYTTTTEGGKSPVRIKQFRTNREVGTEEPVEEEEFIFSKEFSEIFA